jgi:hypothetical protein
MAQQLHRGGGIVQQLLLFDSAPTTMRSHWKDMADSLTQGVLEFFEYFMPGGDEEGNRRLMEAQNGQVDESRSSSVKECWFVREPHFCSTLLDSFTRAIRVLEQLPSRAHHRKLDIIVRAYVHCSELLVEYEPSFCPGSVALFRAVEERGNDLDEGLDGIKTPAWVVCWSDGEPSYDSDVILHVAGTL